MAVKKPAIWEDPEEPCCSRSAHDHRRMYSRPIVSFTAKPPVLRCSGQEDRTTQGLRRRALSRSICSESDLLVDLGELSYADTSLMLDLAMVARRLRTAGATMQIVGAQPQVYGLIEMTGLIRLPSVTVKPEPLPDAAQHVITP